MFHGNWRMPIADTRFFHTKNHLKEGFNMKEFWNTIQLIFTAIGGWLGWFLGGCDGLLYALVVFCRGGLYHGRDVCRSG